MDQLKKFLAIVLKYQFWVMLGLALLVAIVCWWLATAGVAKKFTDRKSTIESAFNNAKVSGAVPNPDVIGKIDDLHKELKQKVFSAWETLYRQQKEKNQLPKSLDEDFKRRFENLKDKGELEPYDREQYRDFIKLHLPKLKEMVGIVDWNDADYMLLESLFDWQQAPSTLAVVLAQEDLWVYEALLRVIKRSNEGANNLTMAAVKKIEALEIGSRAAKAWKEGEGAIFKGGTAAPGAAAPGMPAPGMPGPGMPAPGMPGPGMAGPGMAGPGMAGPGVAPGAQGGAPGAQGGDLEKQMRISDRYMDDKGQPVPFDAESPYYAKHPYAEFKIMPIHMSLVMDQRQIPKLLVECANSTMPIEVNRIRILKTRLGETTTTTGGATSTMPNKPTGGGGMVPGMPSPGMPGPGAMGPGIGPGMGGMGPGPRTSTNDQIEAGPYDVPVEIYGLIYIYQPPNREKLGTGAAAVPAESGAPVATPDAQAAPAAATPAAPPATPAAPPATPPVVPAAAPPPKPPAAGP